MTDAEKPKDDLPGKDGIHQNLAELLPASDSLFTAPAASPLQKILAEKGSL